MRLKAKSLFLGICLAVGILAANVPAVARSTTGWNSFRVWSPLGENYCVGEDHGAAVNVCSYDINLTFELLVDTASWKGVTVIDSPGGYGTLSCQAASFSGVNDGIVASPAQTFNASGQQALYFQVPVNSGWAMSLYCKDVSPGRGIANINWNPA